MENTISMRRLVRIAAAIHQQFAILRSSRHAEVGRRVQAFLAELESLQAMERKLTMCVERQWRMAAAKLVNRWKLPALNRR